MAFLPWQRAIKRAIDIVGASTALVIGAPIVAMTAVAVGRELGRPVMFRQVRPGRGGRPFTLVKFRSMRDAIDRDGRPLPDSERLTTFGKRLRSTSLDELPQLWNVLRGDMSLVGPRPLLMEYLPRYSTEQARRHQVKPGITGWAQINGRNALTWDEKFALDVWYVDHASLWLDLKILVATVRATLARDGVSHGGEVTMPVFMGSRAA
jgi:sugar transferase EpsL